MCLLLLKLAPETHLFLFVAGLAKFPLFLLVKFPKDVENKKKTVCEYTTSSAMLMVPIVFCYDQYRSFTVLLKFCCFQM